MRRRRRSIYNLLNQKGVAFGFIFLFYFIFVVFKNWHENDPISLYLLVAFIGFIVFIHFKGKKDRATEARAALPGQVREISDLLDKFVVDLPTGKHSERDYQITFGTYLKEKMKGVSLEYESKKNHVRPDIVINGNLAIEIKALKNPNSRFNKKYNKDHIESVFKKIFTYTKEYEQVVFVIFNVDLIRGRKFNDYIKMREAIEKGGAHLFEK